MKRVGFLIAAAAVALSTGGCGSDSQDRASTSLTTTTSEPPAPAAPKKGPAFSPQIKAQWVLERDDDSVISNADPAATDYLEMTVKAAVQRTTADGLPDSFAGFQLACGEPDEDAPMTAMRFVYTFKDGPDLTLDPDLKLLLPGDWGSNGTSVDVAIAVDDEVPRCSGTYPAGDPFADSLDLSDHLPFKEGEPLTVRLLLVAGDYRTANYPDGQPRLWSMAKVSQFPMPSVPNGEALPMDVACYDGPRGWPYLGDVRDEPLLPLMPVGNPNDYYDTGSAHAGRRDFADQPQC